MKESSCYAGMRVGRLTLIEHTRVQGKHARYSRGAWRCKCDCGNYVTVRTDGLGLNKATHKGTISCGCFNAENNFASATNKLHQKYVESDSQFGSTYHLLYERWLHIKDRCYNEQSPAYIYYGRRGIKMDDSWYNSYESFKKWAISTGFNASIKGYAQTIDRIDVNGNYEPDNCRWVSMYVQAANRRNNKYVNWYGEKLTYGTIARLFGIKTSVIKYRYEHCGYRNVMLICPFDNRHAGSSNKIIGNKEKIETFYKKRLGEISQVKEGIAE